MAASNSTKKVAKAARASTGRRASAGRANRGLTFPVTLAVIFLLGAVVVFVGRDRRVDAAQTSPRLGEHWHAAYGIYLCDHFNPGLSDRRGDVRGIHTHDDGIIHIHPSSSVAAGERSNLGDFFYEVEAEVSDGRIELPDGEVWEDGRECGEGQPGRVVLARWNRADDPAAPPDIVTDGIADTRFTQDRMAFTLAFVPEARFGEIPRPESIPGLDTLSDLPPSQSGPPAAGDPAGGGEAGDDAGEGGTPPPGGAGDGATTTSPGAAGPTTSAAAPTGTSGSG